MSRTVSASTGSMSSFFLIFVPRFSVAERSRRSVPEPLAGIFLHGPDDVLGVFLGLVFIEQGDDLAHHRLHRLALVADRLSDRNHPDAMLGELAKVKLLFECLAKEPAVTVDQDQLEGLFPGAGALNHLLEDRSAVATDGSSAFDELRSHGIALGAAPIFQLATLVGNRQVVLGL